MLDDKTKTRIAKEAEKAFPQSRSLRQNDTLESRYVELKQEGYIAGAEAEAERSRGLVDFLQKIYKHKETWLNVHQWKELEQVLANYNNSK